MKPYLPDTTGLSHTLAQETDCKPRTCTGACQMGSRTEMGSGWELPSLTPKLSPTDSHFQRGKKSQSLHWVYEPHLKEAPCSTQNKLIAVLRG